MNIESRIAQLKSGKRDIKTNCVGTALFIVGAIPIDSYISPDQTLDYYLSPIILENPEIGSVVLFSNTNGVLIHAGVITNLDPLLMIHRWRVDGRVTIDYPIDNYQEIYRRKNQIIIEYKLPMFSCI